MKSIGYPVHMAECCACGKVRVVCCDGGYKERPNGTTEHDDPYCKKCCPHKNNRGRTRPWPLWERMDCGKE